jgi:hypothetical protein
MNRKERDARIQIEKSKNNLIVNADQIIEIAQRFKALLDGMHAHEVLYPDTFETQPMYMEDIIKNMKHDIHLWICSRRVLDALEVERGNE